MKAVKEFIVWIIPCVVGLSIEGPDHMGKDIIFGIVGFVIYQICWNRWFQHRIKK